MYVDVNGVQPFGFCIPNVLNYALQHGGEIVFGLLIWEAVGAIEGEYHAIWRSPDGWLVDVTKKPDGEKRVLFLPLKEPHWKQAELTKTVREANGSVEGKHYVIPNIVKMK